jgi:glycosyltransferase involved in cell wall biosynthesis
MRLPANPPSELDLPEGFLLSVVIPVYNEIATLEKVVARVAAVAIPKEIILVDDGSRDGSRELLDRLAAPPNIRVFKHERNQGKGAALKTGFREARGSIVVVQDADLEYDPADYAKLLRPFFDARADVVYGSRFLVGEYARVHLFYHYLGNRFLTFLSNLFTGLNLTDMETCYKAFRREVVERIDIKSRRFTVEPELTAKIARLQLRIFEVPISYSGRDYKEGKKITWRDGLAALWAIVRFRFRD